MSESKLKLWKVVGTTTTGSQYTVKVRAENLDEAIRKARHKNTATFTSCVLDEDPPHEE